MSEEQQRHIEILYQMKRDTNIKIFMAAVSILSLVLLIIKETK